MHTINGLNGFGYAERVKHLAKETQMSLFALLGASLDTFQRSLPGLTTSDTQLHMPHCECRQHASQLLTSVIQSMKRISEQKRLFALRKGPHSKGLTSDSYQGPFVIDLVWCIIQGPAYQDSRDAL
eukprot:scaffold271317_cov21-Tisochrysis_lutea.AAC.1